MNRKNKQVHLAATAVGLVMYHLDDSKGSWLDPMTIQLDRAGNVTIDRYAPTKLSSNKWMSALQTQHLYSVHKPLSELVEMYWRTLDKFRATEAGISTPTGQQVVDITRAKKN